MMQNLINRILQEDTLNLIFKILCVIFTMALAYGIGKVGGIFVSTKIINLPRQPALLHSQYLPSSKLSDIGFTQSYFNDILNQNVFDAAISPKKNHPSKDHSKR